MSLAGANVTALFGTPIAVHRFPDSDALDAELRAVILAREASTPSRQHSDAGGWRSDADFQRWSGPPGATVIQRMGELAGHAAKAALSARPGSYTFSWKMAVWAGVTRRGQHDELSSQPGATWSGIYWVDPGRRAGSACARLRLVSPLREQHASFFSDFLPDHHEIEPEAGTMVIFPAYLMRFTTLHQSDDPQIAITFSLRKEPYP